MSPQTGWRRPPTEPKRHGSARLAAARADTEQARLYRAGAAAAAATSSGCRRLGQTILRAPAPPPHNMSAETAAERTPAAGEGRREGPNAAGAGAAAAATASSSRKPKRR